MTTQRAASPTEISCGRRSTRTRSAASTANRARKVRAQTQAATFTVLLRCGRQRRDTGGLSRPQVASRRDRAVAVLTTPSRRDTPLPTLLVSRVPAGGPTGRRVVAHNVSVPTASVPPNYRGGIE